MSNPNVKKIPRIYNDKKSDDNLLPVIRPSISEIKITKKVKRNLDNEKKFSNRYKKLHSIFITQDILVILQMQISGIKYTIAQK